MMIFIKSNGSYFRLRYFSAEKEIEDVLDFLCACDPFEELVLSKAEVVCCSLASPILLHGDVMHHESQLLIGQARLYEKHRHAEGQEREDDYWCELKLNDGYDDYNQKIKDTPFGDCLFSFCDFFDE